MRSCPVIKIKKQEQEETLGGGSTFYESAEMFYLHNKRMFHLNFQTYLQQHCFLG